MGTIFFFSNDEKEASNKKSDGVIISITEKVIGKKLNNNEKEYYISKFVVPVRKSAHFTIYLLLGLIFISLLKEYNIIDKRSVIYTVIFVLLYACSDEIHQLFVRGRSGEVVDVLIDTTGGFIGTMIYKLYRRIRHE
jgi:VanZ family protein